MAESRAYGIVGNPYSGSTLLSFVLGGAPGVFITLETTHILKNPDSCRCRQCGRGECPFWTDAFLARLRESPEDIHELVRERAARLLGASAVVFSDKDPAVYRSSLDRGRRLDGLVLLFKRPEAFVLSAVTHTSWTVEGALDRYVARQQRALGLFRDFAGPSPVVFYDDLAGRAERTVWLICRELGLPFDPGMLDFGGNRERFHTLGGNAGTYAHLKGHGRIVPDERWKTGLSAEMRAQIDRHGPARAMFRSLHERRLSD